MWAELPTGRWLGPGLLLTARARGWAPALESRYCFVLFLFNRKTHLLGSRHPSMGEESSLAEVQTPVQAPGQGQSAAGCNLGLVRVQFSCPGARWGSVRWQSPPQKTSEDLGARLALFKRTREDDTELALAASQQARTLPLCLPEEDVVRGSRAEGASGQLLWGKSVRRESSAACWGPADPGRGVPAPSTLCTGAERISEAVGDSGRWEEPGELRRKDRPAGGAGGTGTWASAG